jgi:hypothetical protein
MATLGYVQLGAGIAWTKVLGHPQIAPAGFRILSALDQAAAARGTVLTLTCTNTGHDPTDPHSRGCAYDIRTIDQDIVTLALVVEDLVRTLGPAFTILYEVQEPPAMKLPLVLDARLYVNAHATGPHLHIQPKRGTEWPPA